MQKSSMSVFPFGGYSDRHFFIPITYSIYNEKNVSARKIGRPRQEISPRRIAGCAEVARRRPRLISKRDPAFIIPAPDQVRGLSLGEI